MDLPVDALRRRRHEPVKARITVPTFDLEKVICTAVRMKLVTRGCDAEKAEVTGTAELSVDLSGHADAPVLKAAARTHGVKYRQLPPTDLAVEVDGPEKGNLSASRRGRRSRATSTCRSRWAGRWRDWSPTPGRPRR